MKRPQPNYKYKASILNTDDDICKIVKDYDFLNKDVPFLDYIDKEHKYVELLAHCGSRVIKEIRKINLAEWKRKCRLKDRIQEYLLMGECIWLTLNFSNEVLANTNDNTRRKYVQRYLKSQSNYFVANIDFGDDHEYTDRHGQHRKATSREHFHALVVSSFIDMTFWNEHYGWAFTERVHNCVKSTEKLPIYLAKLTNHAIKESTKRQCYIYSRCKL